MTLPAVDVHQHLWPEGFLSALSARREAPCLRNGRLRLRGMPEHPVDVDEHRLGTRLRRLDTSGTDVALVSLQPTLGLDDLSEDERAPLVDAYHDGVLELVAAAGGRLRALAYADVREGFAGATVAASELAEALVGGRTLTLLRDLETAEKILFVHPGPTRQGASAPTWWSEVVAYSAEMQSAYVAWLGVGARAYPRLRVLFAVLAGGAPVQLERLASRGVDTRVANAANVFLDTASYGRRALELALETHGVGQVVFGSDAPVLDPRPGLRSVRQFGDAVADLVRRENPSLLLR